MDELLIVLLWVVVWEAVVSRAKRKWIRIALSFLVILVPLAVLGSLFVGTAESKFKMKFEPNWFGYATSLLLDYLIGMTLIIWRAARRDPGPAPAAATWRRRPLAIAWVITVAVGCLLLYGMDKAIRTRCAIERANIKSEYLAELPAITADTQNAAPIYQKAFAHLSDDNENNIPNPPIGNNENFDPNDPETVAFVGRQALTITLLRQAAALPICRFDGDRGDPNFVDFSRNMPELNEERNAALVLNLHAREEIAHGNVSSAIADAAAIFGMSRDFGQRRTIVSVLTGIGISTLAVQTLEEALPAVKSRSELAGLHLEKLPSLRRIFQQGLCGDESMDLSVWEELPSGMTDDSQIWSAADGVEAVFIRVYFVDLDAYIKPMQNAQVLAIQPYFKVRDRLPADRQVSSTIPPGLFASLTYMHSPVLTPMFAVLALAEAEEACAQTAVAMTRYRLDHGSLPSHLDDLVPADMDAVPINPIDGSPLRLAIKNNAWIIYCIGLDGIDHGGAKTKDRRQGGVTFTLKASSAAN